MSTRGEPARLARLSAVDALAEALRQRILEGDLAPGTPLREEASPASTTWRATRCARPCARCRARASSDPPEPRRARDEPVAGGRTQGLSDLRVALEVEAARRALEQGDGQLPASVHDAADAARLALPAPAPVLGTGRRGPRDLPSRDRARRREPAHRSRSPPDGRRAAPVRAAAASLVDLRAHGRRPPRARPPARGRRARRAAPAHRGVDARAARRAGDPL